MSYTKQRIPREFWKKLRLYSIQNNMTTQELMRRLAKNENWLGIKNDKKKKRKDDNFFGF